MNYKLLVISNNIKFYPIPRTSLSGVEFGMKSDDFHQLKFTLNSRNLDITKYIINNKNAQVLLEIGGQRYLFYVAKYEQANKSSYNVNLMIAAYGVKNIETNPYQNQTYNGSLLTLINTLLPNWTVNQINGLDANVSISVGTDDKWETIKKAVDQARWRMRITGYSKDYKPILEYGDASLLPARVQLSNYTTISSFGTQNRIGTLVATISNQYVSQIKATGKWDSGSNPEVQLTGYNANDPNYPIIFGGVLQDQSLVNQVQKPEVKKYTIPATIPVGVQSQDYLYQTARADMIDINSSLLNYTMEVSLSTFIMPLDKVFIHYNKTIKNFSGLNIERLTDSKIIAGIAYNLDTGKVGISLSNTGKFSGGTGSRNILALNKQFKSLTQST
jgi:hypothetical protein